MKFGIKIHRGYDFTPFLKSSPSNIRKLSDLRVFGKTHQVFKQKIPFVKQGFEILACNQAEEEILDPKKDWKYYINEYNFRNSWELESTKPKIGFFGCSYTFGEGIHNDDMFVNIVSKELNMNPFNLGIGGAGSERIARTFAAAVKVIDFNYAVITLPDWSRQMHLDPQGKIINIIPAWPHRDYEKLNDLFLSVDDNFFINQAITYINWISDIAKSNGIKIILSSHVCLVNKLCQLMFPEHTIDTFPNIDDQCARDKMHPGPKSQAAHAEQIIKAFYDRNWI